MEADERAGSDLGSSVDVLDVTSLFLECQRKNPDTMKGKRYTTEDKIRILREADRGKSV